ncbi:hypothetical protein DOY81_012171, partial [Sarcophaga bullata]
LFNSNNEDSGQKSNVSLRFRHLDTNVRPSSSRRNSGAGSTPSPENDTGVINVLKSPKKSPNLPRKGSNANTVNHN